MERQGNRIIFDTSEQKDFDVQPEVDIVSAVATSLRFLATAENLTRRIDTLTDSTNSTAVNLRQGLSVRAAELARFSAGISALCSTEIIEMALEGVKPTE